MSCITCFASIASGVRSPGQRILGGDIYSINLACLDGVDAAVLVSALIRYYDGRNNNWQSQPSETRHL